MKLKPFYLSSFIPQNTHLIPLTVFLLCIQVYSAALIGQFNKVVAIDAITSLIERGEKRQKRWDLMSENFTQKMREVMFEFIEDNFIMTNFWTEASFLLLHWTAFSTEQRNLVTKILTECLEGTQIITFTNPIPSDDWQILVQDTCEVSWGKADFYFQEKITPAGPKVILNNNGGGN